MRGPMVSMTAKLLSAPFLKFICAWMLMSSGSSVTSFVPDRIVLSVDLTFQIQPFAMNPSIQKPWLIRPCFQLVFNPCTHGPTALMSPTRLLPPTRDFFSFMGYSPSQIVIAQTFKSQIFSHRQMNASGTDSGMSGLTGHQFVLVPAS